MTKVSCFFHLPKQPGARCRLHLDAEDLRYINQIRQGLGRTRKEKKKYLRACLAATSLPRNVGENRAEEHTVKEAPFGSSKI
jgi:hypothetical protein